VAVGWVTAAVLSALLTVTVQQIDHWQDERSLATHADDVVPDNYLARDSLALLAVEAGRPADAVGLARSAADLAPDVPKVHHVYGLALQAAGQMRQAFYEFEQAIKLEPRDPYVRNDFGTLLVAMHFDKDALAQFRRALALNPALPAAHLNLGAALASRGDYPAAAVEFRRALELDPQMAGAEGDLASALQRGGDPAAAVEHYRIAAEQGDGRPDTLAQLAWLTATDAGSSPHDLAAVAPLAKQSCDDGQAGRQPFPWYAYSAVLARLGRFDDAINAGTRASALARSSGQAALAAAIDRRLAAYRQGWVVMGASTEPVTPPAAPARGR